jgi:hypothetical protein
VRGHEALDYAGQRHFAQSADGEARQRDADLHAGNDAVQIAEQMLHDFCLGVSAGDQLADARDSHRDKRELGGSKKAVQRDQHEHTDKAYQKHAFWRVP